MMSNSILDVNCLRASLMSVWARYSRRMLRYDTSNDSLHIIPPCTWWQSPGAGGAASCAELSWCQPTSPRCPWWCWCPVAACRSCPAPGDRRTALWWGYWPWPRVCCSDLWWSPGHSCCHREDSVWWANSWKSKHLNDHEMYECHWPVILLVRGTESEPVCLVTAADLPLPHVTIERVTRHGVLWEHSQPVAEQVWGQDLS